MTKQILKLLTLVFPVVATLGMVALHSQNMFGGGSQWIFKVDGYDPRDILRGHYLTFRYDWNWDDGERNECSGYKCALCLEGDPDQGDVMNSKVNSRSLERAGRTCDHYIAGYARGEHFEIGGRKGHGLTRYYIPEKDASRLDKLLRSRDENASDFTVGLSVKANGRAYIRQMYIDGVPLEDWIKANSE